MTLAILMQFHDVTSSSDTVKSPLCSGNFCEDVNFWTLCYNLVTVKIMTIAL